MVLIGILSVARGVFLLFPQMCVRTTYLKAVLVTMLGALAWYVSRPTVLESVPMGTRWIVLALLLFSTLFLLPRGSLSEEQKKTLVEYMDSVIIAGVTALFLIWFIVRSFYIPSESMKPTLLINDMLLVNEFVYRIYKPAHGDIVVFRPPPAANSEGKDFIKRIIAVEGDKIEIKGGDMGRVYRNGQLVDESYRMPRREDEFDFPGDTEVKAYTVPPGHVMVMGDNRGNSDDSRHWGFLPVQNIIGKAFVVFYPLGRIHWLK